MKISGAHLQMVSNDCTFFQKKSMQASLRTCLDKIMSTNGVQTDGWTDRVKPIYPSPKLCLRGYIITIFWPFLLTSFEKARAVHFLKPFIQYSYHKTHINRNIHVYNIFTIHCLEMNTDFYLNNSEYLYLQWVCF